MGLNISIGGRNETNLSPTQSLAIVFIAVIAGFALAGYGFVQYQDQVESVENAVGITATITDTNVRTDSSRRGGVDYQAEIDFEYSYEGQNYSSDFIYPLDNDREFGQESEAEEYLENYSTGDQINAYVNPDNPDQGFLKAQKSDQPLLFMIIGGFLILIGGYNSVKRII